MGSAIWTLSPESSGWTRAIASTNLASGAERLSVYITAGQSACPSLSRATYPAKGPAAAIAFGLIPARPASHSPCSRRVPHCSVDCSKMSPCICESTSADQFHCFCPVRSNAVNRMLCVPRSMASKSALDMLSILFFEVPKGVRSSKHTRHTTRPNRLGKSLAAVASQLSPRRFKTWPLR